MCSSAGAVRAYRAVACLERVCFALREPSGATWLDEPARSEQLF
eukprot:COSAG06_NODE_50042_length_320_cov_0.801802_1_plen_43_part_01